MARLADFAAAIDGEAGAGDVLTAVATALTSAADVEEIVAYSVDAAAASVSLVRRDADGRSETRILPAAADLDVLRPPKPPSSFSSRTPTR